MRDKFDDLRGLRLAVLAPISWPVPPPGYGPWEQISYNIAQGMRARGLDVTLYAAGNSHFEGRLRSVVPISLNEDRALDGNVFEGIHIGTLFEEAERFD
ncbi:MAG: glycosyltransferase family 4 protein, partial [Candidatus Eremiobacteraeota bacterium]|nr:glycosyltransferase family 4 protein [Candidatus Eremiobacteraeota bacterium]